MSFRNVIGNVGRGLVHGAEAGLQDLSNAITPPPAAAPPAPAQVSAQVQALLDSHPAHVDGTEYPEAAKLTMNPDGSHSLPNIDDEYLPDPKTGVLSKNPAFTSKWQTEPVLDEKGKPVLNDDKTPQIKVKMDEQGQPLMNDAYAHMSSVHDQWGALNDAIQKSYAEGGQLYKQADTDLQRGSANLAAQEAASAPSMPARSPLSRFAIALGTQNPNTLDTLHQPNVGLNEAAKTDMTAYEVARQKDQQLNAIKEQALTGHIQALLQQGRFKEALAASNEMKMLYAENRQQFSQDQQGRSFAEREHVLGLSNDNMLARLHQTNIWGNQKFNTEQKNVADRWMVGEMDKWRRSQVGATGFLPTPADEDTHMLQLKGQYQPTLLPEGGSSAPANARPPKPAPAAPAGKMIQLQKSGAPFGQPITLDEFNRRGGAAAAKRAGYTFIQK